MKCYEYVGRQTATQQRRKCDRDAVYETYFLGEWRPLCPRHRAQYEDLPMRRVDHGSMLARR